MFFYCTRAETDPAFVKYPRLPVLFCPGYVYDEAAAARPTAENDERPQ